MANLGFYSRHLTEEEVQGITATTRRLILANTQVSVLDSGPASYPSCCPAACWLLLFKIF